MTRSNALQVLHHVGLGRADGLDGDGQRLDARLVGRQKEVADARCAFAERHGAARASSALRSDAVTCSSLSFTIASPSTALMPACAHPPRCALTPIRLLRPSSAAIADLRIALALERDVDAELLARACRARPDSRASALGDDRAARSSPSRTRTHCRRVAASAADVVDAIRRDRLGRARAER